MTSSDPAATDRRAPSAIDDLAERFVAEQCALSPLDATYAGIPGYDHLLPDLGPDGLAALSDLRRRTLTELGRLDPVDDIDRVTVAAMTDTLGTEEDLHAAHEDAASLNVIASPVQSVRDIFDLMSTDTDDDWAVVAQRLAAIPDALAGYRAALLAAADAGAAPARRQVTLGAEQCAANTGTDGFFATFTGGADVSDAVRADLDRGAQAAATAYDELGAFLRDDFAARAADRDPVGRERYALHSRSFLGTRVDLEETYEWGQDELARITAEMERTADRILPGASVTEAIAHLDASPDYQLQGTDALREWMQTTADEAIAALAGTHFDIPEPIRRIECMIAPTQQGGIYYTGPSEDLTTRPGRMWWSVPAGITEFGTWRERTTVYHEGVPGHHLQIAQTTYRANLLNRWRRLLSWVSGHGEGWALYAEKLMSDLGFLDDPADYLGMLDGQSMRAARVVLDIGVHCELPAPAEVGGGAWDYDKAWRFLSSHANMADGFLRFELNRYLGWPGQAPSYKIGERIWLQLRDEVRAAEGDAFDLASFHRRALDVGSVGLDALRGALV